MLKFIEKCGLSYETIRSQAQVVHRFPFTSSRKRMSVVTRTNDGRQRLVLKGASELVLEACSSFHSFNNEVVPLDDSMRNSCRQAIDSMAKEALRTLVFAYKDLSGTESMGFPSWIL